MTQHAPVREAILTPNEYCLLYSLNAAAEFLDHFPEEWARFAKLRRFPENIALCSPSMPLLNFWHHFCTQARKRRGGHSSNLCSVPCGLCSALCGLSSVLRDICADSLCSMPWALCSVLCAPCSVLCALCSVFCALCSVTCALCRSLCSVLCGLCSVLCAL